MADQYGVDLGNVLSRAEDIQAARIQNQFRPKLLQQQATGNDLANQGAAVGLSDKRRAYNDETHARNLRAAAAGGDTGAMTGLATIDPGGAKQFHDYLDSLDEDKKKQVGETIDKMGKLITYVKGADDPDKAYLKAKELLTPDAQAQMPATWDADWGDATLAQALELKDLVTKNGGKDAPSGYRWEPNGNLAPIPGGPADKKGKGGDSLDTTAANGIRATVAQQFGGEYDPQTGEFSLLDRTQAPRMLEVMAKAQDMLRDDPSITPARAVQDAMKAVPSGDGADDEGAGDADTGNVMAGQPKAIQSQADYDALKSGDTFIDPGDGKTYTKP